MLLLLLGCAHPTTVGDYRAYAEALREGRVKEAYALTGAAYREKTSEAAFAQRFADPGARKPAAERVERAVAQLQAAAPELAGVPAETAQVAAARTVLVAFVEAAEARRFSAVYPLLCGALRARYTPASLARDFALAPLAGERVHRAELAAKGPATVEGQEVRFPVGGGRAVVLVSEAEGFKVASLE